MNEMKANIRYFTRHAAVRDTGLGLMIGGGAGIVLGWMLFYYLMIAGVLALVVGIALFFIATAGSSTEADLMRQIEQRKTEGGVDLDRSLQKRADKKQDPVIFEGFVYDDEVYLKRMKNGKICSSKFEYAVLHFLNDAFYVERRVFSLVTDEQSASTREIPFAQLKDIIKEHEKSTLIRGRVGFTVKESRLTFLCDGEDGISLLIQDDAHADELIARLKKAAELQA